jgi:hypothetical protein
VFHLLLITFHSACIRICSERLTEGVLSPYNTIRELQHYASALAAVEPHPATASLSPDCQTISINSKPLSIATWRNGLQNIVKDIRERYVKVLKGLDIDYSIPIDLFDNMNDTKGGVGWINGKFTKVDNPLIQHYLKIPNYKFAYVGPDGGFHFYPGPALEFMEDMEYINQRLCLLNAQANSENTRGTAHIDTRVRNGMRRRGHYRETGLIRNVIQQSKKSHVNHHDEYIPVLMADVPQELDEVYLIYFRPVEEAIAFYLWGNASRMVYREFLYVQMGLRVTESMLYKQFPRAFEEYFGVNYGILEYRHWTVTVMREFIEEEHWLKPKGSRVGDKIADHSTTRSRLTYARNEYDLPYLTTDLTWWFDRFCRLWQDVAGFGPNPDRLPVALKLIRLGQSAGLVSSSKISDPTNPMDAMVCVHNRLDTMEQMIGRNKAELSAALGEFRYQINQDFRKALAEGFSVFAQTNGGANTSLTLPISAFSNQDMAHHTQLPALQAPIHSTAHIIGTPAFVAQQQSPGATQLDQDFEMANTHPTAVAGPSRTSESAPMEVVQEETLHEFDPQLEKSAKAALCQALGDRNADWKSEEQRKTVLHSLSPSKHMVSVVNTGEGKSMAWIICSLLQTLVTVVIVPFHTLLQQHLDNARRMGCKAMKWTADMQSIGDNNLIFMAMETAASKGMAG